MWEAARSSTRGSGWAASGPASLPWECRGTQSHQARPAEVQEPTSGSTQGRRFDHAALPLAVMVSTTDSSEASGG